jgi:predicted flap endonuclease-1-like 5' DNA nuclease
MVRSEFRNGPSLGGLILAGMAGFLAFFALVLVGEFELTPAVAVAGVITAVVAVIAGLPATELPGPVQPGTIARPKPAVPQTAVPQTAVSRAAHPVVAPAAVAAAPVLASPVMASTVSADAEGAVQAPARMDGPRGGVADDLKEIEGIGPAMEKLCHDLGFFHFDQIAGWSPAEVAWVDQNLKGFKGRVSRDRWVAQAQFIQSNGLEAFRVAARTNDC